MIHKANPSEMRKALEVVGAFRRAGISFVPIPVFTPEQCEKAAALSAENIDAALDSKKDENDGY